MLPSSIQTLEDELKRAQVCDTVTTVGTCRHMHALSHTQEAVEAYKRQNQFLSSEILELNNVRTEDLETYRITSRWVCIN